jgi:uracil-DNA glycosylase
MQVKIEPGWYSRLIEEFDKPYFKLLTIKVREAYQTQDIWPQEKDIFNAFEKCPFDQVKVVILGQDPYPTPGHAHGLCFSVAEDVKPIPKSLQNIFKEIQADLNIPFPQNGNLERWAKARCILA